MSEVKNLDSKEFVYNIGHKKLARFLPQEWGIAKSNPFTTTNAFVELCRYTYKMFDALYDIKKFYKEEFNNDNSYTIDEYINIFQDLTDKINNIVTKDAFLPKNKDYNKTLPFSKQKNFSIYEREGYGNRVLNKKAFAWDRRDMIGFSEEAYKKILPLAKQMFMLEKMCSFTTRKFWKSEMTSFRNLDTNKPFKMVVRVVMPTNWRTVEKSVSVADYYRYKKYVSASIIDNEHKKNLFMYNIWKHGEAALLVLDCNEKSFICADPNDCYSEEAIDGFIPFEDKAFSSQLSRVDTLRRNKKDYEFFANAVEISTPKGVIEKLWGVSEVDLRNPRVIGVIAPNKMSVEFAKQMAKRHNVPFKELTTFVQG